ncbi:MAG: DNA-3-methyladenine glycosylase [Actinomycetes bacterium]
MTTPDSGDPLPRSFFARPVIEVAPDLLGRVVVRTDDEGVVAVRLTEVEAYAGGDDPGSHAFRGPTPRTGVMFGPPGHVYVYFSYGMHWCANLVCGPEGHASAVLLRGGEVVAGHDLARRRRPAARADRDLARGPARLAACLGLVGEHSGDDVCAPGSHLRVGSGVPVPPACVRTGPRVGVSGAGGDGEVHPWRFWVDSDPTVSAYRPAVPRRRRRA